MTRSDAPSLPSPFHAGELKVQQRLGVAEKVAPFGRKFIRDHLIDQHRTFFAQLPFVLLATVDAERRPWASLVAGPPGFLTTPDEHTLQIAANPLQGDPLRQTLKPGIPVGLLGLELETRRRNRMNGEVQTVADGRITIAVKQSFGNCPRFIQTRQVAPEAEPRAPRVQAPAGTFTQPVRTIIDRADTLFIASAPGDDEGDAAHGADVSHRGGKPGFVRIEDERTFVFPDFSGNNLFNTIGNLVLNPKAGFLFPDFETGDLVFMTGATEIIWDGPRVEAFKGAERLVRFRAEEIVHVEAGLPFSFTFGDFAPNLKTTGDWES